MFKPKKIFYEKDIEDYPLGKYLLDKYKDIPKTIIDNHNNIEELRNYNNKDFPLLKKYLIIGIRKTHKFVPNYKVSNYLVPYTSSGCSAMCLYCYLVCNYNKCSYLRLFVNREEMLDKIIKVSNKSDTGLVFEIGSNSDLILENLITHNLEWTIEKFAKEGKGYLTFPTKFHQVEPLLNLNHNRKIIVRVSMNPNEIIKKIELGTSMLKDRITALNKLCESNYIVGILIAPVIYFPNYKELYEELFIELSIKLSEKAKKEVFFEVILMTYSYVHDKINSDAFPDSVKLYNKEYMKGRGREKYTYKDDIRTKMEKHIKYLLNKYFKNNKVVYFS